MEISRIPLIIVRGRSKMDDGLNNVNSEAALMAVSILVQTLPAA